MEGLDLGIYGDGEFVLSGNGKRSVTVAELSENVNLGHVVPNGFHQLQVGSLNALK